MNDTEVLNDGPPRNPEVATEPRDTRAGGVVAFAVGLTILGVVGHLVCWWVFAHFDDREEKAKQSAFPLAVDNRLPPEPRLEGIQRVQGEKRPVRAAEKFSAAPAGEYRWVDQKAGVVQIPLEAAVKLVVEQNSQGGRK